MAFGPPGEALGVNPAARWPDPGGDAHSTGDFLVGRGGGGVGSLPCAASHQGGALPVAGAAVQVVLQQGQV